MLSIVTVFWGDLVALIKGWQTVVNKKALYSLLAGTIATGFVGIVLGSFLESVRTACCNRFYAVDYRYPCFLISG